MEEILNFVLVIVSILIASTFHEFAHAWTANHLGDPTPKAQGRLSVNPFRHIDVVGAISLLLFNFGWSKPVQINPFNFKSPVIGNAIVAVAGPLSNLTLMLLVAIPLRLLRLAAPGETYNLIESFFLPFLHVNAVLMLFNLIPIPPLDGSRIIKVIFPKDWQAAWEGLDKYGFIILIALLVLPISPFGAGLSHLLSSGVSGLVELTLGL